MEDGLEWQHEVKSYFTPEKIIFSTSSLAVDSVHNYFILWWPKNFWLIFGWHNLVAFLAIQMFLADIWQKNFRRRLTGLYLTWCQIRVSLKLLRVHFMDEMCWDNHIDTLYAKVNKQLHFLKLLEWSSVLSEECNPTYQSMLHQPGLTSWQCHSLKSVLLKHNFWVIRLWSTMCCMWQWITKYYAW
jgi:hypothetical protein